MLDMKGSKILSVEKNTTVIRNEMCCKKCALSGYNNSMNAFIVFTIRHEEKVRKEEGE